MHSTISIPFESELKKGSFIKRPNRFLAKVLIEGAVELAHIADPGRLKELLVPGKKVYLLPKEGDKRKTKWQLVLVEHQGILVSVYSQLPNKLIYAALQKKVLPEFSDYSYVKPEYTISNSRFDFALAAKKADLFDPECLVEVKSVTLVEKQVALFPDAPTKRGVRHLNELVDLKQKGLNGAVLFLVQRKDAKAVSANKKTDPVFSETLSRARENGVKVVAYRSRLDLGGITLLDKIPVLF